MRKLAYLATVLGMVSLFGARAAQAQAPAAPAVCSPECGPGQVCADGVCVASGQAADPNAPNAAGAPPPNGYPPPAGYPPPQGYPPANGYPPGSYPPPPPSAYAPGTYVPPAGPPAWRRGFLALPYIGAQSYAGDNASNLGVGFRLGTLLGGHISPNLSLNGELVFDIDNPKNVPAGLDYTEAQVEIEFSPLVHVPQDNVELVFGPKIGIWALAEQASANGLTAKGRANGYVFGLNAGAFFGLSSGAALGALLSFAWRYPTDVCTTAPGEAEMCPPVTDHTTIKVFGFTGAALF
jgi:hypothetical protein